jgi:hypothetical protein
MKKIVAAIALLAGMSLGGWIIADEPLIIEAQAVEEMPAETKSWSFWEVPGIKQMSHFFDQAMTKSRLKQAFSRFSNQWSSRLSSKEEAKKDPIKVQAIQYLAKLDSRSYPDIVDTLLASLDDASEKVRYEALSAINAKQLASLCIHRPAGPSSMTGATADACDCAGCVFRKKVIDRLNALLLAQDEKGGLKEKSQRIRDLATEMIESCLSPSEMAAEAALEGKTVQSDTLSTDLQTPPTSNETTRKGWSRGIFPRWFGGKSSTENVPESPSTASNDKHTVGYRGTSTSYEGDVPTAPAIAGERVIIAPPQSTWATPTKRSSRWSTIFGY